MKEKIKSNQKSEQINSFNQIKKYECNIERYAYEWDFVPSFRVWSKIVSIRTEDFAFVIYNERWLFFEFLFLNIKLYFGIKLYVVKHDNKVGDKILALFE